MDEDFTRVVLGQYWMIADEAKKDSEITTSGQIMSSVDPGELS